MTAAEKHQSAGDEGKAGLFEPDVLLPDEYQATFRRTVHLEPERRLMVAVLEDGIACYKKYYDAKRPRYKTLFQETEDWFFGKGNGWFFSFETVCETLGIDPDYLREGLLKWKEDQLRPKAKVYHLDPKNRTRTGGLEGSKPDPTVPHVLKNGTD